MGPTERAKVLLWGQSPETREERKLLMKIDASVLSFLCLMYWSNYLNRTNLQFAYVSGMKEEIGFGGNDLTTATTVFTVGYTVGQIPHAFAIQYFPARLWLPLMTCLWGVLSCCLSATQNPGGVYAVRFLQALFESSTFSGAHWLLGSWYKDAELGKRSALFASSAQLGSLFSGILQGAIFDSLNGKLGLSGWRWCFIIDGLIAIVIAFYGLVVFPNTPRTTKAFYLTPTERALAVDRIPERPHESITFAAARSIILGWRYWCFSLLFTVSSQLEAYGTNGIVAIWLKSTGLYSTSKNDYYALGLIAVAIATTWVAGICTDLFGHRWRVNIFMAVALIVSASMLLAWDIPLGAKYFAFYLGGCGYAGQGSNFAWANESSRSDVERSFILYSMNLWSNAVTAWWILIFWPVTSSPRYRRGFIVTIPIAVVTVVVAGGTEWLCWRGRKRGEEPSARVRQEEKGRQEEDGGVGEEEVVKGEEGKGSWTGDGEGEERWASGEETVNGHDKADGDKGL